MPERNFEIISRVGRGDGMSKFDRAAFYSDDGVFIGVSQQKYTIFEAYELARYELGGEVRLIGSQAARHRAGRDEDGNCCVGWWLEPLGTKRSCPVWVFEEGADES